MVQTGNGRGEIVGAAIIKNEDASTLQWVAKCFKQENSNACSKIRCFMSDKDLNERNAFIKWSETEDQYNHFYEILCKTAPDCVLNYFNKNWHSNRHEWSKYSMIKGNFGNLTNNIVESMNKQIKVITELRSTLCNFGKNFFALLKSQNQETNLKSATNYLKRLNLNDTEDNSIQQQYADYLTTYAYKKINKELSTYKRIVLSNYSPDTDESTIATKLSTYVTSSSQCSCHFFQSNNLPCRHIMAHRAFVNKPIFDHNLCANKWSKKYEVQLHETSSLGSTIISKIPVRSIKIVSQRRKALSERANDLIEISSLSTGETYKKKEELLDKLIEGWRQGRIGKIVFKDEFEPRCSRQK
ncbi:hypothetical protein KQX54_007414 [Cotesia glomerata]|uniref:SWIM-type domain-containing protein n=1 Tax=Cotesia glomerata TaxID=32391 RepID=A0AAV7HS99_COTGL|nr:hypothetical protein KQX54_007414 [Cotesia glomerata]